MNESDRSVSLVIPGRNASDTIEHCLEAVVGFLGRDGLAEIIFVDDGSTDDTAKIVERFPVRYIRGEGRGPGSARNIGWRAAKHGIVWFIDSDCVAEPGALEHLLPHLEDAKVGAVSGSYGNMRPDSLLACLIHEEIIERHLGSPKRVSFLATFNVAYRRSVLEQVGGFDERFLKGQDAELSWRVLEAGYELAFEIESRVKHFHAAQWRQYLRTQRQQGYWRVFLYLAHRGHATGDTYSSLLDHIQPPLAMLTLASLVFSPCPHFRHLRYAPLFGMLLILIATVPMTWRLVRRTREARYLCFSLMSLVRAFWRGVGMTVGMLATLRTRKAR